MELLLKYMWVLSVYSTEYW